MKFTLTSLFGLFFAFSMFAQANQQPAPGDIAKVEQTRVKKWIQAHPEVKLIALDDYMKSSPSERAEVVNASPRFLHKHSIPTWSEIETFETSGFQEGELNMEDLYIELQGVDQWIAQHPEIKLIEFSEFQSLTSAKRSYYMSLDNVIIYNVHLRQEDIDAYQTN